MRVSLNALFTAVVFLIAAPAAQAAEAYATTALHLRAGPHSNLPVVVTLQRHERVELLGCVDGYQWCEVRTSNDEYGWASSYYLRTVSGNNSYAIINTDGYGSTRIIIYKPRDYWDTHYRNKSFYRDRDRWFRDNNGHDDHDQWNDDYHGNQNYRPRPKPQPVQEAPPTNQKMQPFGKGGYNPLCRIGQKDC